MLTHSIVIEEKLFRLVVYFNSLDLSHSSISSGGLELLKVQLFLLFVSITVMITKDMESERVLLFFVIYLIHSFSISFPS